MSFSAIHRHELTNNRSCLVNRILQEERLIEQPFGRTKEENERMATSDAEGKVDDNDKTKVLEEVTEKGKTFRKRRLSLTNLRQLDYDSGEDDEKCDNNDGIRGSSSSRTDLVDGEESGNRDNDKAHTFRKRRLSLTSSNNDPTSSLTSTIDDHESTNTFKRLRKESDELVSNSCSSDVVNSRNRYLKSKTLHAAEILSPSPRDCSLLPKLYQKAAPPQQFSFVNDSEVKSPKWKERHIRPHAEDDKSLPFPRDVVGTFSCHGVEPIYDDSDSHPSLGEENEDTATVSNGESIPKKLTMAAKINQDRGGVAFPYGNSARTALFAVYDGMYTLSTSNLYVHCYLVPNISSYFFSAKTK